MEPELHQLENGLTVILQEDHTAPVVAIQVWVSVGSADETPAEAGLAHVHEHMLFKGTERRGVGDIATAIESAGGIINAWTSFDQTVYHVVVASRYAELGLEVLSDAVRSSTFDGEELSRELEVIQEEIKRSQDLPSRVLSENLFAVAFQEHPYGRPIIGTAESVASFTREDVLAFFRRWYGADNITVVVVGDFDSERMRSQVEAHFGSIPPSTGVRTARSDEPQQVSLRTTVTTHEVQEGRLAVAFHVPGLADPDVPALELLAIMLGQGESSLLYSALRRRRRLATDVYSYLYTPREPGILVTGINFRSGAQGQDPHDVLEALLEEIFKLRYLPVSSEELRRAKTMLESETVYERETVQGRAGRLGYFHVVAGDLDFERHFMDRVARVTADDIRRVAHQYLSPENLTVGFVLDNELEGQVTEQTIAERVQSAQRTVEALQLEDGLIPDDHGVVRHLFPNGLTLLILEDHTVPIVSIRSVYPGGLRFENADNNGINAFVAELLTQGTEGRTSEEIAREIESLAGSIAGYSGRNSIGLSMVTLSRDFEQGLVLFADCAQNSAFPEDEVERIREQILSEIEAMQDDLAGSAFRQLYRTLFAGNPFQFDVIGTTESVGSLSRDDLLQFFRVHLQTSRMTLAVVGDVSAREVVQAVERAFNVTVEEELPEVSVAPIFPQPREQVESHRDRQQAHLVLGFQSVAMGHPDRWPLMLLAAILSGQSGRLFLELRDRQSLAYSVSAFNLVGLDTGFFAAYIATSPEKVDEAIESMEREIRRIHDEPVSIDELERAQRYLVGEREISLQRASNRAAYLAFDEAYGLGYDFGFRYAEYILEVTPEDIQRVARQYLDLESGVLSIVRPTNGAVESRD